MPALESFDVLYFNRCDAACPAEAKVRVLRFTGGELAFCRHHYRKYALALVADGWQPAS